MLNLKYSRILIKLSGEGLMGDGRHMFDPKTISNIIGQIKEINQMQVRLGIVIGGGNIFRGIQAKELGIQRANADYMGIMATIINGIALKDLLVKYGIKVTLQSALPIGNVISPFNRDRMLEAMDNGHVVILAGGTGNPFFTTDSGAALRAVEMNAELLIKATKVDGIYDKDPHKSPDALLYKNISFDEAIEKNLKIMDMAAFDLCRNHNIAIQVCNIFSPQALKNIVLGKHIGTVVHL